MTSHSTLQPTQHTQTQRAQLAARVKANASIIWPGQGRSFELDFETDDHMSWTCVLQELCGDPTEVQWFEVRTMTLLFSSTERAAQALDRMLADWAGQKVAKEREGAREG